MRLFIFILSLLFPFLPTSAQPKHEVRAAWVTAVYGLDWPRTRATTPQTIRKQKEELTDILDKLKAANFNTVLFQTRTRGDVLYTSAIEPFNSILTGKTGGNPGYDPLAFAIRKRSAAVNRRPHLQCDPRRAPRHPGEEPPVAFPGLFLKHAAGGRDSSRFEHGKPLSGDERIRILHGGDNASHAVVDKRQRAGRRAPIVRAGFKRHIHRGAFDIHTALLRVGERFNLRMVAARLLREAARDDFPVPHDHTADRRVRGRERPSFRGKPYRLLHEIAVRMLHPSSPSAQAPREGARRTPRASQR